MQPKRELSLFDSTCIIVGIIVGAGIYETAPTVAGCMAASPYILGIWVAGGLLALTGALCYAELATAYPHQGGDYVYLNRAYGRGAGFLFGWILELKRISCKPPFPKPGILCSVARNAFTLSLCTSGVDISRSKYTLSNSSVSGEGFSLALS